MGTQCTCSVFKIQQAEISAIQTDDKLPTEQNLALPTLDQKSSYESVPSEQPEFMIQNKSILKARANSRRRLSDSDRERRQKMIEIYLEEEKKNDNITILDERLKPEDISQVETIIRKNFIFNQLRNKEIKLLISKMSYCTAQQTTYIFKKGDPSLSFYVILEGECDIYMNDQVIDVCGPGDSFGELGIIYNAPRSASAYVRKKCLMVKLNREEFQKLKEKLNEFYEKENYAALSKLQFYIDLNKNQKKILAANLIRETYEAGQIIFNKGDEAHAFYIIREGIVTIMEKKIDIKQGETFGQNAILTSENTVRTCSLVAKTKCILLSITKKLIFNALGDSMVNIVKKNLVKKIIKESHIHEMHTEREWIKIFDSAKFETVKQNQIVYKAGDQILPEKLNVILSTDLANSSKSRKIMANSIIQAEVAFRKEVHTFQESFIAINDGFLAILSTELQKNEEQQQVVFSKKIRQRSMLHSISIATNTLYIIKKLGNGSLSSLYACYCPQTKNKYAAKVLAKKFVNSSKLREYAFAEQQIFRELPPHPFIVEFYKVLQTKNYYAIILEMIEGVEFFSVMQEKIVFEESELRFYITQIVLMLEHLHKNKIIYRDLKPENIMIAIDGYLKLIDMNTAKVLKQSNNFRTATVIGTPHYIAPEILFSKNYSFQADLWTMGIFFFEMAFGYLPFGHETDDIVEVYNQILNKRLTFTNSSNKYLQSLIQTLLSKVPSRRFGGDFDQLKTHKYFTGTSWSSFFQKKALPPYYPKAHNRISLQKISQCLTNDKKIQQFIQNL